MHKLISFFTKPQTLLLILVVLIGLFFRNYKAVERFEYAHDGDLYSWIAKDIIIDKHPRLIGQLTSAEGIYIGPLYYYVNVPFFLMFNMDPIGAMVPIAILGFFSLTSIYWVFQKLYNKQVAFISTFLYATSWHIFQLDRRVVPSTPAYLWVIWYFYCIVSIARGNYNVLPILGILIGLIWHIHIALLPALIAIPVAAVAARKLPNLKQLLYFFISLFVTSIPLLLFEVRHSFIQTISLYENFTKNHGGSTGENKLFEVLQMISKNLNDIFISPIDIPFIKNIGFMVVILSIGLWLANKKAFQIKEFFVLLVWIFGVILFFTFSSSPISEYYFANIEIIFIMIIGFALTFLFQSSKLGKIITLAILSLLFVKSFIGINGDYYNKGYLERKQIVEFIQQDAKQKGYPCVSISYITAIGENVGFRYFLWLYNVKTVRPTTGAPIYNIVLPDELALGNVDQKYGHVGVIVPKNEVDLSTPEQIQKACEQGNNNLTDPMFGFTN